MGFSGSVGKFEKNKGIFYEHLQQADSLVFAHVTYRRDTVRDYKEEEACKVDKIFVNIIQKRQFLYRVGDGITDTDPNLKQSSEQGSGYVVFNNISWYIDLK